MLNYSVAELRYNKMKTKYSYKQIWTITFPILISLIMEQMIGMTDTAFLGRVGEI
jgi:Na+-driven multidrug efflux pump